MLQILVLSLVCCGSNGDTEPVSAFKVAQTELSFPASQSENSIYVESQSTPEAVCEVSWLHVKNAVRNGESSRIWVIKVSADENKATETRTATIAVGADGQKATVKIEQAAAISDNPSDTDDPDIADYTLPELSFPTDDNIGETAQQTVKNIFAGWNIGNSLEVPDGETAWGNPATTQKLIDGVKAAGFNAVRIPCAWNSHLVADAEPFTIDPAWLKRVREVVDYAYRNGMYVIINTHWDGGWLELHANANDCAAVVKKEKAIWTQIAAEFADYGQRLIFAGNNEIRNKVGGNENWGTPLMPCVLPAARMLSVISLYSHGAAIPGEHWTHSLCRPTRRSLTSWPKYISMTRWILPIQTRNYVPGATAKASTLPTTITKKIISTIFSGCLKQISLIKAIR